MTYPITQNSFMTYLLNLNAKSWGNTRVVACSGIEATAAAVDKAEGATAVVRR